MSWVQRAVSVTTSARSGPSLSMSSRMATASTVSSRVPAADIAGTPTPREKGSSTSAIVSVHGCFPHQRGWREHPVLFALGGKIKRLNSRYNVGIVTRR